MTPTATRSPPTSPTTPFISAAELPSFEVVTMETPTPYNPLGREGRRRVGDDRVDPRGAVQRSSTRSRTSACVISTCRPPPNGCGEPSRRRGKEWPDDRTSRRPRGRSITGTGGGQGRAAGAAVRREGARSSAATSRPTAPRDGRARARRRRGDGLAGAGIDLTDEDSVRAWIDFAVDAYGDFDILYNNAAAIRTGTDRRDVA